MEAHTISPRDTHRSPLITDLALLCGDGCVLPDEPREDTSQRLNAERERRHIEEEHILHLPREHPTLDGGAHRHCLIRVHGVTGRPSEDLLDSLLNLMVTHYYQRSQWNRTSILWNLRIKDTLGPTFWPFVERLPSLGS